MYQFQSVQARRKLLREEIDKAKSALEELFKLAIDFHTNNSSTMQVYDLAVKVSDFDRRTKLWPKIARRRSLRLLEAAAPSKVTISPDLIIRLRKAITLEHFGDTSSEPLNVNDPQLTEILDSVEDIKEALGDALVEALD